jgi:hypothetical protein
LRDSILKFNCIVNIILSNEFRAPCAIRDYVLTDRPRVSATCKKGFLPMLYLKNTLGGLSRSLADSAVNTFRGPHRWWKLALFAGLIVLPGGSVAAALLAWVEHRRQTKRAKRAAVVVENGTTAEAIALREVLPQQSFAVTAKNTAASALTAVSALNAANANSTCKPIAGSACPARGGAACRAAAGKGARRPAQQSKSAGSRL